MPKSVMLSDVNINIAAEQILDSPLPLCRKDVFLNIMPPFIAYGTVLGIHTVCVGGMESVIIPKFDPSVFDKLILKYRPACIMGVPTHFDGILGSKKMRGKDLSFLKVAFVGGDKIKEDAEERINDFLMKHYCNIKISKGYSLTEASATATFASRDCNKLGSVGTPLAKTIVAAFEDTLDKEMKYEEMGKLFICSPTIMMGYYANEDETKHVIKTDKAGNRWLYTGDLGYVDEDGCVYVIGREKRMIIRHDGFKVFPNVIEQVVEGLAEIKECTVVGADDSDHSQGKVPVAFVVLNQNEVVDNAEIVLKAKEICKKKLPEYAQPEKWNVIETMPLTSIGKVDYRALEKMAEAAK